MKTIGLSILVFVLASCEVLPPVAVVVEGRYGIYGYSPKGGLSVKPKSDEYRILGRNVRIHPEK